MLGPFPSSFRLCCCGQSVSASGDGLDASLADEAVQGVGDGGRPGGGLLADFALRQRPCCLCDDGEDAPGSGFGLGVVWCRFHHLQGWSGPGLGELEFDFVEPGCDRR